MANHCCTEKTPFIYRGSTPTVILKINTKDFEMSEIDVCHITMENDNGRNKKVFENVTVDTEEKTLSVELTQEDTLSFDYGNLNVQGKIKLHNGRTCFTEVEVLLVKRVLEETVL